MDCFSQKSGWQRIRFWPDTEPVEIPQKLKEYIDRNRDSMPPITDPDEPLQIDSLGLIRMVAFLESELGYRIEDEELISENFETLRNLGAFLASKEPTQVASPVQSKIVTFVAWRKGEDPEVPESLAKGRIARSGAPDN
jgi:acyl carrier protein